MLVDTIAISDVGYLVDNDGDDSYDAFIDGDGGVGVVEVGGDGWYKVDVEGDGVVDYRYDLETDTLETQTMGEQDTKNTTSNRLPLEILGIIVIIILLIVLLGLLYQRRTK